MRFSNTCPKCGERDILFIEGSVGLYGGGNNIRFKFDSAVLVKRYVCCRCGYSEEWIAKDDISKLEKYYPKQIL